MKDIKLNEYEENVHFNALNRDNYNLSKSCEYEKKGMSHIHESTEILFVEDGIAEYYVSGKKYVIEARDILIIGPREYHMCKLRELPFLRYGLTIRPCYYKSLKVNEDLLRIFQTPPPEDFVKHFKNVDVEVFEELVYLLKRLYAEEDGYQDFRGVIECSILNQIAVTLYRLSGLKQEESSVSSMYGRMLEIKEYIDGNYQSLLGLNILSELFYLHPVTISKEFNRCFGQSLTKYLNSVRICEGARLLESTEMTVTDIAVECGYDNINTFLRQFKAIMEVTPLKYRKSIREWLKRKKP